MQVPTFYATVHVDGINLGTHKLDEPWHNGVQARGRRWLPFHASEAHVTFTCGKVSEPVQAGPTASDVLHGEQPLVIGDDEYTAFVNVSNRTSNRNGGPICNWTVAVSRHKEQPRKPEPPDAGALAVLAK